MQEAQAGSADLKDVEQHTFIRFCEYAYTGDYTPANHEVMFDSSAIEGDATLPKNSDCNVPVNSIAMDEEAPPELLSYRISKKKGRKIEKTDMPCESCGHTPGEVPKSLKQVLWDEFKNKRYSDFMPRFEPRRNFGACEDYTNVFLGHADLYVFADRYMVARLRMLALEKLHRTLEVFNLYENRIGDIINLIRYSYSNDNTKDSDHKQDIDDLRTLVTHYVACVFEIVARNNSFLELMADGGPFVRDLTGILLRRLDR
jgi:DNA-directed RNA polymerase subunit H (RpoH/RPB5)